MTILREEDPEGVAVRRRKRLKRRQYYNKVCNYFIVTQCVVLYRAPTTSGMLMAMISCHPMGSPYMAVLMGIHVHIINAI